VCAYHVVSHVSRHIVMYHVMSHVSCHIASTMSHRTYHAMSHVSWHVARIMSHRTYHVMSHISCHIASTMSHRTYHAMSHASCHIVRACVSLTHSPLAFFPGATFHTPETDSTKTCTPRDRPASRRSATPQGPGPSFGNARPSAQACDISLPQGR
jgi:hypothetical protein